MLYTNKNLNYEFFRSTTHHLLEEKCELKITHKTGGIKISVFTYIASDCPLKEVENPHVKTLSVNQALEIGIEVANFLLEPSFDRDKPNVILWVDDDKNFGEISIRAFSRDDLLYDIYSEKKYLAQLEWEYTECRAKKLIEYIKDHLNKVDEIELWNTWLGKDTNKLKAKIKMHHIPIEQLTCLDLEKLFNKDTFNFPECVVVSKVK